MQIKHKALAVLACAILVVLFVCVWHLRTTVEKTGAQTAATNGALTTGGDGVSDSLEPPPGRRAAIHDPGATAIHPSKTIQVVDRNSRKPIAGARIDRVETGSPVPLDQGRVEQGDIEDGAWIYNLRPFGSYALPIRNREFVVATDDQGVVDKEKLGNGKFLISHGGYAIHSVALKTDEAESSAVVIELLPAATVLINTSSPDSGSLQGLYASVVCVDATPLSPGEEALRTSFPGITQEPVVTGTRHGMAGPSDEFGAIRELALPCDHEYSISIVGGRGALPRVQVPCAGARDAIRVPVGQDGKIHGRLVAPNDAPMADIGVLAQSRSTVKSAMARSDSRGEFTIEHVTIGANRVRFEKLGVSAIDVVVTADSVTDLGSIVCPRQAKMTGKVIACTPEDSTALYVHLRGSGDFDLGTTVAPGGEFEAMVPDAPIELTVTRQDGVDPQPLARVGAHPGEEVVLDLRDRCATLVAACKPVISEGKVKVTLVQSAPPSAALTRRQLGVSYQVTLPIVDGRVEIVTALKGTYDIYMWNDSVGGAWFERVYIDHDGRSELGQAEFGFSTVQVQLPSGGSTKPVAAGEIHLNSVAYGTRAFQPGGESNVQLEAKVPPGRWSLSPSVDSTLCWKREELVVHTAETRTVQQGSDAPGHVQGVVVRSGVAVENQLVTAFDISNRAAGKSCRTNSEGRFEVGPFGEAVVNIVVGTEGELSSTVQTHCAATTVCNIELEAQVVDVRLVVGGEAVRVSRMTAVDIDPQSPAFGTERTASLTGDGRWRVGVSGERTLLKYWDAWNWPNGAVWCGKTNALVSNKDTEVESGSISIVSAAGELAPSALRAYLTSDRHGTDLTWLCSIPLVTESSGDKSVVVSSLPPGATITLIGRATDGQLVSKLATVPATGGMSVAWP